MKPRVGRADGMAFALLNTANFGIGGGVCPQAPAFVAEEPTFAGSLGVDFDIYQSADLGDVSNNHVSIYFNGERKTQIHVGAFDLAGGHWIHAKITIRKRADRPSSDVTIALTPAGGSTVTIVEAFEVTGLTPYEGRAHFGARSGGEASDHDLDNVDVRFASVTQSTLSFSSSWLSAFEQGTSISATVIRSGPATDEVSVQYATQDLTAGAGFDYTARSGTLTFAAGETAKSISVPILNDPVAEAREKFEIRLSGPSGAAVVAGPAVATVAIADDETARVAGEWSDILLWPHVAIHAALLPTGRVMFWEDAGQNDEVRLWNPANGALTTPVLPGHDIFCAGHSFLADGTLFITGGHIPVGEGHSGLAHAASYNAVTDTWMHFPEMNEGRWYPTNTTLGNGDVLVISGDVHNHEGVGHVVNYLPQVFQVASETWRDLTAAAAQPVNVTAHGVDLYPRMFLTPDGKVFKAGPDRDTWILDVAGAGSWTPGPLMAFTAPRTYGPAVLRNGLVYVFGGGEPPTATAERIDLAVLGGGWTTLAPMPQARRQHNATLLPDGAILITGGTSSAAFNDATAAAMTAELYDPDANTWTTLGAMQVKRGYHSTALLLPDGRVLSAGGGAPAADFDHDHRDAEIFSPPYLFKGARPVIASVPAVLAFGHAFSVQTPDAAAIARLTLIRIGAVTHAFDQNQRFLSLAFTQSGDRLTATVPGPNLTPPGHYMLFLVNATGVPSIASIVQLLPNAGPAVNAGVDRSLVLPASATLTGSVADDGVGALSVQWIQLSGPASASIASPTSLTTGMTFAAAGLYTFRLTVSDTFVTASDDVVVAAHPAPSGTRPRDFNRDGAHDLLWHHRNNGSIGVWFMQGTALVDGRLLDPPAVPDTRWKPAATADFDADGNLDILWQHDEGLLAVWTMQGATRRDVLWLEPDRLPSAAWRVRAAADMNGDGAPDLVLQHQTEGWVGVWYLVGTRLLDGRLFTPSRVTDTGWRIAAAADVDRDGVADLVWQHANGALAAWLMTGASTKDIVFLSPDRVPDPGWRVVGEADINADGWPDLLMQHDTSNLVAVWLMQGVTLLDGRLFNPGALSDAGWRLAGPR
jgi:hypothetical protein